MLHGCKEHWYVINNKRYLAIVQGADGHDGVCHDCNARPGEYHHPGCDNEICPACGGQMIGYHEDCVISDTVYVR